LWYKEGVVYLIKIHPIYLVTCSCTQTL